MLIKDLKNCEEIIAADKSVLREILHPKNEPVRIRYSIAHALVRPGETTLPHRMKTTEVYYILEGQGIMHIEDESEKVFPGQAVYILPGSKQYIMNTGNFDLKFLCMVDPAWRSEDEVPA
jgi:mannose-6-phosphate isomerase-like protein (cupin superfamily)